MHQLKSLLPELTATLKQYNVAAYEDLLPPLPDEEIDKQLKELGIDDENIKALFQWKSGTEDNKSSQLTEYGSLLNFNDMKYLIKLNEYYDKRLIPLITETGEDMLLFNTNPGPHYGKLYLFSVAQLYIDHPVSIYDSLSSMLETTIEAYRTGAFKYDIEDNWLDIDFDNYYSIAKKHNKNAIFWTDHDELRWEDWYEI